MPSGRFAACSIALPCPFRPNNVHLVALEHARHGEDVSDIVVHDQHFLAREDGVRIVQALQDFALRLPANGDASRCSQSAV